MSYASARQRSTQGYENSSKQSNKCIANGCPMRGTVSPGGTQFVCVYHHEAKPEDWPRVTDSLLQNEKIRMAIDEVLGMGEAEWSMSKWQMMDRFFDDEIELKPTFAERAHRRWYEYRLREWLMHLTGVMRRKPAKRESLKIISKKGNMGALLRHP